MSDSCASVAESAAAGSGTELSARRKMQELGRKPAKDGGIGDKILAVMASKSAQDLSSFYLSVFAGDCPALTRSDQAVAFLEIGHGSGQMLDEACKLNQHSDSTFTGIEWSEDMHALAKTIATDPRVNLIIGDANADLPFDGGTFDIVASAHCVCFWDDLSASIAEQARLLKPGGVLCIVMSEATKVRVRQAPLHFRAQRPCSQAWDRDVYKNVDVDGIKQAMVAAGLQVQNKQIADEHATYGEEEGVDGGADVNEIMQFFAESAPKELFEAKYDMYMVGHKL